MIFFKSRKTNSRSALYTHYYYKLFLCSFIAILLKPADAYDKTCCKKVFLIINAVDTSASVSLKNSLVKNWKDHGRKLYIQILGTLNVYEEKIGI